MKLPAEPLVLILLLFITQAAFLPTLIPVVYLPQMVLGFLLILSILTTQPTSDRLRLPNGVLMSLAAASGLLVGIVSTNVLFITLLYIALALAVRLASAHWIESSVNFKSLSLIVFMLVIAYPTMMTMFTDYDIALRHWPLFAIINVLALLPISFYAYVRS